MLIVRPKVTWTSAIRVFLTHLNTERQQESRAMTVYTQILPVAQFYYLRLLTPSEFKDLSYEHEARFSQSVFFAVRLISVVRQVAVVVVVFLQMTSGIGNMVGKRL